MKSEYQFGQADYRARYYNPQLQRFISEDPLEFRGGDANLYAYVWNSPLNFIDPFGWWGVGVNGGASAGLGGWATGFRRRQGRSANVS